MRHSTQRAALAAAAVVAAVTATALPAASAAPAAPRTAGVSVTPGGTAGNAAASTAVISRDGKVVAFDSEASDLVAGDANGRSDVFVRTLATGRTERVALPGRQLRSPSLSGDGRYVAVITAPADDYGASDVRLYDRRTKKFQRLDVELPDGFDGKGAGTVALTPNARYAVFDTRKREGSDGQVVFLRDREKKTTERISHPNPGWEPRSAHTPTVSDDGREVVYAHNYTNGPRGDDWSDVWLRDRTTGRLTQIDRSHDGSTTEKESLEPSLSGDGRTVVFESRDTHLVPHDDDKAWNVFVHDLATGKNRRVHGTQGGPGAAYTRAPAISADGRRLTYMTEVREPGSQYGTEQPVYVRDLKTGRTALVTPDATGGTASAKAVPGAISANGKRVAFLSADAGLLPGDTNDGYDAFVRYLG
ncbi:PD40 domain-containing protein [Streptomyces sp. MNP-20]|uniref:TolB family protein n=1 Tax=Streptomyces sp. MNP-20 TaxID=2721165 RepID=UPI001555BF75|nr:PD40 domain-containing protein [Streptomyces sp. MNP-20]